MAGYISRNSYRICDYCPSYNKNNRQDCLIYPHSCYEGDEKKVGWVVPPTVYAISRGMWQKYRLIANKTSKTSTL